MISILNSSAVSIMLLVSGIAYLIFVGQPEKGVQRHPFWPYLTWSIFGLCFAATIVVASVGYTVATIGPRMLTKNLIEILKESLILPDGINYKISIVADMSCSDCAAYRAQLASTIESVPGWHADHPGIIGPRFLSHGLALRALQSDPKARILINALRKAKASAHLPSIR